MRILKISFVVLLGASIAGMVLPGIDGGGKALESQAWDYLESELAGYHLLPVCSTSIQMENQAEEGQPLLLWHISDPYCIPHPEWQQIDLVHRLAKLAIQPF